MLKTQQRLRIKNQNTFAQVVSKIALSTTHDKRAQSVVKHNLNGPLILDHQYKVLITVEALDLKKGRINYSDKITRRL